MIDTHTHLYLPEFSGQDSSGSVAAVDRAVAAGVRRMIFPNVDCTTVGPMIELHSLRPAETAVAMGLHPTEIGENWREDLDTILRHLDDGSRFVAVGEIGIDLYWDKTFEQQQMQALELQLRRAVDLDLPVIIHCREGLPQTLEVVSGVSGLRGVMHSFGGTIADVEAVRKVADFYFGINGIVTFKNSGLRETLPAIGLARLLLETDSPYLAPVPHRGRRNESAYLVHTAAHIADSLGISMQALDRATTDNACTLFRKL